MGRKTKFVVGRIFRQSTTLYLLQGTTSPIQGPWVLRAVISSN
jgi:hypothetical protein